MKFLLCGALLALSVWSHAEGAKVLGFTMDAPAPDGAALVEAGADYAPHRMEHRLCAELIAASDDLGVFMVACASAVGVDWSALLRGKYGVPIFEQGELTFWAADGFAFIVRGGSSFFWWAPRSARKLGTDSSEDEARAALKDVVGKLNDMLTSIQAAENADVIAEEEATDEMEEGKEDIIEQLEELEEAEDDTVEDEDGSTGEDQPDDGGSDEDPVEDVVDEVEVANEEDVTAEDTKQQLEDRLEEIEAETQLLSQGRVALIATVELRNAGIQARLDNLRKTLRALQEEANLVRTAEDERFGEDYYTNLFSAILNLITRGDPFYTGHDTSQEIDALLAVSEHLEQRINEVKAEIQDWESQIVK